VNDRGWKEVEIRKDNLLIKVKIVTRIENHILSLFLRFTRDCSHSSLYLLPSSALKGIVKSSSLKYVYRTYRIRIRT
jgi:hypothetical protein